MRATRPLFVVAVLAAAAALSLGLTAAALAADGVPVIPAPLATPDYGQREPAVDGDILAYGSCDPRLGFDDDQVIRLKFLWDASAPRAIARPAGFKDMQPAVLVDGATIYVVWTRLRLAEPWDSDLWIWKGAYRTPDAGGMVQFVADPGYPRVLVSGPDQSPLSTQQAPAIGSVTIGADRHVVVAWEDTRQTCPGVPEIYRMDLTEQQEWDPASAGEAADPTGILGRGQHLPEVGPAGIYWLDERLSWWDGGDLTDTAVWRFDVAAAVSAPYFKETDHAYDNGLDEAPQVTWNGALWLRRGPYGDAGALPYVKGAGAPSRTLGPLMRPFDISTYTKDGAATTGLAVAATHGDRLDAVDADIFFFDVATGQRVPVCNRGNPAGTDPEAHPDFYTYQQMGPELGNASYGYRVIWVDRRASAAEDTPDSRLYEAFVPAVRASIRTTTARNLRPLSVQVTVQPDFSGEPVRLQQVKPGKLLGATVYRPVGRGYLATGTMTAGAAAHSSVATLKWTPRAKGTYYLRAWFPGATKYTYDGLTVAGADFTPVPHVGNFSRVLKITVK